MQIKISAMRYNVVFGNPTAEESPSTVGIDGYVKYGKGEIFIRNDPEFLSEYVVETLLHEMMHVMFDACGMNFNDEVQVTALSHVLHAVIVDNPLLFSEARLLEFVEAGGREKEGAVHPKEQADSPDPCPGYITAVQAQEFMGNYPRIDMTPDTALDFSDNMYAFFASIASQSDSYAGNSPVPYGVEWVLWEREEDRRLFLTPAVGFVGGAGVSRWWKFPSFFEVNLVDGKLTTKA